MFLLQEARKDRSNEAPTLLISVCRHRWAVELGFCSSVSSISLYSASVTTLPVREEFCNPVVLDFSYMSICEDLPFVTRYYSVEFGCLQVNLLLLVKKVWFVWELSNFLGFFFFWNLKNHASCWAHGQSCLALYVKQQPRNNLPHGSVYEYQIVVAFVFEHVSVWCNYFRTCWSFDGIRYKLRWMNAWITMDLTE
jgi:hypothetical protein